MKFALILSGQPRGYKKAYEYLKRNYLDDFSPDVFIHTWKNDVYPLKDIEALYRPKDMVVSNPLSTEDCKSVDSMFTRNPQPDIWPPSATWQSFASMIIGAELMMSYDEKYDIGYDYVMRTRFDFALNIDMKNMLPRADPFKIMVPDDRGNLPDFANDQWAFGSPDGIFNYCSTFFNLSKFYDEGIFMIGEDMLSANIRKELIGRGYSLDHINMRHPFPPGKYNGSFHSLVRDDMDLWKKS